MSIWAAFGFVALGMALAHLYNWMAWRKYYEGKREGRSGKTDSVAQKGTTWDNMGQQGTAWNNMGQRRK